MLAMTIMRLKSASNGEVKVFDYTGTHRYLITLTTFRSTPVFQDSAHVVPVLDALRKVVLVEHFDVLAYCFLPDRLVLVVQGKTRTANLKVFLRAFRSQSAAAVQHLPGRELWKKTYLERVLRKTEETRKVARDVFSLPVRQGLAGSARAYPFLGSFVEDVDSILRPTLKPRHRFTRHP